MFSKLRSLLTAAVLAVGVLWGVFRYGKASQREEAAHDALRRYKETQDEINSVDHLDDADARFKRMRDNGLIR